MKKDKKPFITIVSGSPRSGTSMMMRMLEAGGLSVVTDSFPPPDQFNVGGYYEHANVRKLYNQQDGSWLWMAEGKVVKIFYRGIPALPSIYDYLVIFMERPLEDSITSWKRLVVQWSPMDAAKGLPEAMRPDVRDVVTANKAAALAFVKTQPHIKVMHVAYADVLADPTGQSEAIEKFLKLGLDTVKMAAVVAGAASISDEADEIR